MCGIYLTNRRITIEEAKLKLESIRFRGPDYTGIKEMNDIIFGHLRLSIIDLEARSNQPMSYENLLIIFNGEIYNYLSIKEELERLGHSFVTTSDTEVLLHGYKQWGDEIVNKLNGMFAFVIYDSDKNTLFGSRDRLGVKPFFYYAKDGIFEVCSQLRPISFGKSINKAAVSMYLDCTYVPSPFTIYENVYKLPPGKNLYIDLNSGNLQIKEYWNLTEVKESNISYEEAKDQVHNLLKDAVKIRLQSDVPFGSFLSGGIDSALVSAIASKIAPSKVKTFSIGFEDPKYDESKIAAQYAEILNTEHTETICKPEDILEMIPKLVEVYDEPFGDSSALPSLLLNKVTKQYVTMALSGDGGDESFLGYHHFDWTKKFQKLVKIPYIYRNVISNFLFEGIFGKRGELFKKIFRTRTIEDFITGIFVGYNSLLVTRDLSWLSYYKESIGWSKDPFQKSADLNIKLWLENDSNVKVDRASMAYSVEVRSPFLDYRIIEYARTLPVEYRYANGIKKKITKDILKEYIPEEIFNQPKRGFAVPIGSWIRKELREEFVSNLSDDFLNQVPNLNVKKFKKMFEQHLSGKYDHSSYIWRVYVLSKWYQEFGFYKKA
ncbi:asparagine synthase (glutamine-hydrolyzing) [Sphingobacterium sp. Lzh-3]|uniref:asparagine synthase (glutamine-hydrolyzing) n=1 Tax=Sphingobacterium sp. Lzh-3 TaxID=3382150 RepID=UPI00398CF928